MPRELFDGKPYIILLKLSRSMLITTLMMCRCFRTQPDDACKLRSFVCGHTECIVCGCLWISSRAALQIVNFIGCGFSG